MKDEEHDEEKAGVARVKVSSITATARVSPLRLDSHLPVVCYLEPTRHERGRTQQGGYRWSRR